jgi:hypothetical protein
VLPSVAAADPGFSESSAGAFGNAVETPGSPNVVYCGGSGQVSCGSLGIPTDGAQVRWGGADSPNQQSGLAYVPTPGPVTPAQPFVLGTLVHYNNVVRLNEPTVTSVTLSISVAVVDGGGTTVVSGSIPVSIGVDETDNVDAGGHDLPLASCAYQPAAAPCPDKIFIPGTVATLVGNQPGVRYTLSILGFEADPSGAGAPQSSFLSQENTTSTAGYLFAQLTVNHAPVADAGPPQAVDQTSPAGATVTLNGTGSSDPDGDPLSYSWTGPFGAASGATPSVTLQVGTSTVRLTVNDGELTSGPSTTTVTVYPPITAAGTAVTAVEGAPFTGTVATFTDPDPAGAAGEYSATIDWGDSLTTTGTISGTAASFTVSGTHTYLEEGLYTVTVTITDTDNAFNSDTATTPATVADAALTSLCGAPATSLQAFDATTATFVDADPNGTVSDYAATIDWGDGTHSTGGVSGLDGGPFAVTATHAYETTGPFTVTTTIDDVGGSRTSTSCKVLVYAFPAGGGAFVIGDRNNTTGAGVTFWGAQWWKLNILGGGTAPAAFKGYALHPATPSCGTAWDTGPGNSPPPPAGPLPAFMGVIVTSSADKAGSKLAGDTAHIVVVQTNAGYDANPGHAGTGTIVAQVC